MNKTALFEYHRLVRTIFVFATCALICLEPMQIVVADGAPPPEPDMGGVAPYQPIETNVQMMSETVLINVLPSPTRWTSTEFNWNPNQVKVSASFTLRNQGEEKEQMQVIFPLTRLDYPWSTSSYNIIGSSFVAIVDGKPVPTTTVSTPPELQALPEGFDVELPDGFFVPDVQWAGFDVTFPVHEDVVVQVEYDMQGDITTGLHHVDYILETGAGWYGNILSADFIVRFPYPATSESILEAPTGCVFSGNEVQCKMENFEPRRKDNLTFGFIDTNEWSPTLELRSRVEQYPDDANAWYELGGKYYNLGLWREDVIINQHMVDLSIDAYEKAVALHPEWGDAHLQLARVLWYSNPKYRRGFGGSAIQKDLTMDDPLVQRALQELKLAVTYGVPGDIHNYIFVTQMYRVIPDLEKSLLSTPIVPTAAATLPTMTPGNTSYSLQKVIRIAAGNYHTCVLVPGEVKCDGWNLETRATGDFTAVAAGDYYTCMLTTSSGVKCMGKNSFGQLGNGTTTDQNVPVDVVGLTIGVSALAAGDNHTCALSLNGGVKCWGRNFFGQLGNGTTAYSFVPVDVHGLSSGVTALAVGSNHTCVLLVSGGVKCWGANEAGQLGDGSLINRLKPVDVVGLSGDVIALSAGFAHTCALTSQGQVMCWGDNNHGQLGDSDLVVHTRPVIVAGLGRNIVKLVAGNGYSCALTSNGGVKCWGRKQLYPDPSGNGVMPPEQSTPYDVDGFTSDVVDLAAGNDHICGLMQNDRVKCWGLMWFAYHGLESHYVVQFDSTPTISVSPEAPSLTPAVLSTTVPIETSSPAPGSAWGLALVIAICIFVLLYRRLKSARGK